MLKKLIRLNADDLWLYIGVEGGVFLLAQIIICAAMVFTGEGDSISIMGMVLPIIAGILVLIAGLSHVTILFEQAIAFGQTRRRALGLISGLIAFQGAVALGIAALLTAVERFLCPYLWAALAGKSGWITEGPVAVPEYQAEAWKAARAASGLLYVDSFLLDWWWWLLVLAAGIMGGFIIGAIAQRFGSKGLWIIWMIWMTVIFAPQLFGGNALGIGDWSIWMIPVAAVFVIAGLIWSIWSLLHASIK